MNFWKFSTLCVLWLIYVSWYCFDCDLIAFREMSTCLHEPRYHSYQISWWKPVRWMFHFSVGLCVMLLFFIKFLFVLLISFLLSFGYVNHILTSIYGIIYVDLESFYIAFYWNTVSSPFLCTPAYVKHLK